MTSKAFQSGTRRHKRLTAKTKAQAGRNTSAYKIATVWLSVKDAAEQLGISPTTLRTRIKEGYFRTKPALTGKGTLVEIPAQ